MNVNLDIIEEDITVTLEVFEGSAPGLNGKSAYQDWIDLGNVGSVQDFFEFLKGEDAKWTEKTKSEFISIPVKDPNKLYIIIG